MPSIAPSAVPKLAADLGYAVIADQYKTDELLFPRFTRAIDPGMMTDAPLGHKWVGGLSDATPTRRYPGQAVVMHGALEGYARQMAYRQFADSISIPDELIEAETGRGRAGTMIESFIATFTRKAMAQKDQLCFDVLQKGTLSAGDVPTFDNAYPGAPLTAPGLIYDGKPLFAASGNNHPLRNSSTTKYNLVVSGALNASNLDAAFTLCDSTNAVDESGTKIAISANLLIVPYGLRGTARALLESEGEPGTANNNINTNRGRANLLVSRYLTDDTDGWFLLEAGRSIVTADSGAPVIETWRDNTHKCTVVSAQYRFGVAVDDWRGAVAYNKATS